MKNLTKLYLVAVIVFTALNCQKNELDEPSTNNQNAETIIDENSSLEKEKPAYTGRYFPISENAKLFGYLRETGLWHQSSSQRSIGDADSIDYESVFEITDSLETFRVHTFLVRDDQPDFFVNMIIEEFPIGNFKAPYVLKYDMLPEFRSMLESGQTTLDYFEGEISKYPVDVLFNGNGPGFRDPTVGECWEIIFGQGSGGAGGIIQIGSPPGPHGPGIPPPTTTPGGGTACSFRVEAVACGCPPHHGPGQFCTCTKPDITNAVIVKCPGQNIIDPNNNPATGRDPIDDLCLEILEVAGLIESIQPTLEQDMDQGQTSNMFELFGKNIGLNPLEIICLK